LIAGGTAVTITGTNFQSGATVQFGTTAAIPVTFVSSSELQTVTPEVSAPGPVSVTVTNPNGQSGSLSPGFTYVGSHSVSLAWDASASVIIGYNVYRGTTSGGPYMMINTSLVDTTCTSGSTCTYTDNSVAGNATYYYVVTAVDPYEIESVYSNEAGPAAVPGP
jgi:fibronectin type 3 domain-containing protein